MNNSLTPEVPVITYSVCYQFLDDGRVRTAIHYKERDSSEETKLLEKDFAGSNVAYYCVRAAIRTHRAFKSMRDIWNK